MEKLLVKSDEISLNIGIGQEVLEKILNRAVKTRIESGTGTIGTSELKLTIDNDRLNISGFIEGGIDLLGPQRVGLNVCYVNSGSEIKLDGEPKIDLNLNTRAKVASKIAGWFGHGIDLGANIAGLLNDPTGILSDGLKEYVADYGFEMKSFGLHIDSESLNMSALAKWPEIHQI